MCRCNCSCRIGSSVERIALAAREAKVRNMTPTVMIDMAAEMKRCEDADSCHTFLTLCLAPSHLT